MNSESPDDRSFHVAVFAAPDDPHELADALAEVLGIHPTDAMIHSRLAPGILPDRLSREQAERLAAAINEAGLHAESVSADEIPDFGHGEAVHHVQCPEEGLDIFGLRGGLDDCVPWNEIEFICVGVVPQETTKHYLTSEIATVYSARRTMPALVEVPVFVGPELWFIRRNPHHAYRVHHKRMNYEYLGERKTDSATVNFRLFLDDLLRHTPHAYVTPSTRAFLGHDAERLYHFDSTEHLQRYAQFHYLAHQRAAKQPTASACTKTESPAASDSSFSRKSP